MAGNLLASLTLAGVLQRRGGRSGSRLRVAPRFLDHAERQAATRADPVRALEDALVTWDGYANDVRLGARLLHDLLAERDQLGALRPVFPALESFTTAAA
ncbi:MAG: hypothetical protein ACPGQL_01235 [Thermoplasmatota archaeon]